MSPTIVLTGQHPQLALSDFALDRLPSVALRCAGREDPHDHVRSVTRSLRPLLSHGPDLLVVQGDTSSALGAALAGFTADVPVAHVEAGLRTHDPQLPWPEEEYRTAIDASADLLFAPTELAAANLHAEQVAGEILVTGNTSIDAVLEIEAQLPARRLRESRQRSVLVTCHRRENWNGGLESVAEALREIAAEDGVEIDVVPPPNPFVASRLRELLDGVENVDLLAPCSHLELVRRMRDADLVLSDSGGIQEEAPALGVPLLVLREKTERPEAVAAGAALLVGTNSDRIVGEARRLLRDPLAHTAMSRRIFPFGDGRAGPRIAAAIEQWLHERSLTRRLA